MKKLTPDEYIKEIAGHIGFIRSVTGKEWKAVPIISTSEINGLLIFYKVINVSELIKTITKKHPEIGLFSFIIQEDGTN